MRRRTRAGFSLIEVMAAVMLLAVSLTLMLQLRNDAVGAATQARNQSIASRLGLQLLHRIEAARMQDLFDCYVGDFSDEGFPEFTFTIGLGDGSVCAQGAGDSDSEQAWRKVEEDRYEEETEDDAKPEHTRVFLTVNYPGGAGEEMSFHLETLIATWAVYQDFDLYEDLWKGNLPEDIE